MRFIVVIAMLVAMFSTGGCQEQHASNPTSSAQQLHWTQTEIPNLQMAVVSENAGTNTIRLQAFKEVCVPPHSHPADETLTVIAGSPKLGEGSQFVDAGLRALHPGEKVPLAKNTRHFVLFHAGDEIEMQGEGKFATVWVDPRAVKELKKNDVDSASERSKMKADQDKR